MSMTSANKGRLLGSASALLVFASCLVVTASLVRSGRVFHADGTPVAAMSMGLGIAGAAVLAVAVLHYLVLKGGDRITLMLDLAFLTYWIVWIRFGDGYAIQLAVLGILVAVIDIVRSATTIVETS